MSPLILLVEDDVQALNNLKELLELKNYKTIGETNALNALKTLSNLDNLPDLIISDIIMPEMEGYDFYKKVSENQNWNRIPFFFLSARDEPFDVKFGKMLGVDDYITKPFKFEDLLNRIEKILLMNKTEKLASRVIKDKMLYELDLEFMSLVQKVKTEVISTFFIIFDSAGNIILKNEYPESSTISTKLENLISSVCSSILKIYEFEDIFKSRKYVLRIEKNSFDIYILVEKNSKKKRDTKGEKTYIVGVISTKLHYLQALRIKEILEELGNIINKEEEWNLKDYYEKILEICSIKN
ncbi:MAG: PleD family two-component system response regulator [Promethearchaeota archaeon]